eukprot:TRINITY_DN13878_c0_g2_i1.p1 TRINITY_DN13878_c0_g2~~TRINITY_DN13878_c0_g2_i1.p1  ORF type:complete len:135 (+),score=1.14 TRINITY_DN13878_c0_g2_i1:343-747(+)
MTGIALAKSATLHRSGKPQSAAHQSGTATFPDLDCALRAALPWYAHDRKHTFVHLIYVHLYPDYQRRKGNSDASLCASMDRYTAGEHSGRNTTGQATMPATQSKHLSLHLMRDSNEQGVMCVRSDLYHATHTLS